MAERPAFFAVIVDRDYERLRYALVLAAAAGALDRPVTLFFSGDAVLALTPTGVAALGGEAAERDARNLATGVATLGELLEAIPALNGRILVCEAALKSLGMGLADLDPRHGVQATGAVSFLRAAEEAAAAPLYV